MANSTYLDGQYFDMLSTYWRGCVLAGGLPLGQLNGTRDGASVKPAVAIDSQRLASIFPKVGGAVDGLEQREEAWEVSG